MYVSFSQSSDEFLASFLHLYHRRRHNKKRFIISFFLSAASFRFFDLESNASIVLISFFENQFNSKIRSPLDTLLAHMKTGWIIGGAKDLVVAKPLFTFSVSVKQNAAKQLHDDLAMR